MPVKRLRLLQLGGEPDFHLYQGHFNQIFEADEIYDPLDRRVYFPPAACRHICFTGDPSSLDPSLRTVWQQDRAECIEWLYHALTDPDEIRPNNQQPGNEVYLLEVLPDQIVAKYPAYYYASARPEPGRGRVVLLTAYPVRFEYWARARRDNKPLHRRPRY